MTELAIRGHATRGKEIIELLEMLGGKNKYNVDAIRDYCIYFVENGIISTLKLNQVLPNQFTIFTLEEFLEKYPYRVGDKVIIKEGDGRYYIIKNINWHSNLIRYDAFWPGQTSYLYNYHAEKLQPYKEQETMDKFKSRNVETYLKVWNETENGLEVCVAEGYEMTEKNGQFYIVKKSQYPKNYKECCDVLNIPNDERYIDIDVPLDYNKLLSAFTELIICRNAYWKIAGEQMGLNKPWEPDWLNEEQDKFVLYTHNDVIYSNRFVYGHNVLTFPTEEMRDVFHKNFMNLIEGCKKLL